MEFEYCREPIEEFEEPGSELENTIELEITIFEREPLLDEVPEYDLINDDYMERELERQEQKNQEDLEKLLNPIIP